MKHGTKRGIRVRYWLELLPIDTGGVQLRRMMAHGARGDVSATVGQWRFDSVEDAQRYALARFGETPAMI